MVANIAQNTGKLWQRKLPKTGESVLMRQMTLKALNIIC